MNDCFPTMNPIVPKFAAGRQRYGPHARSLAARGQHRSVTEVGLGAAPRGHMTGCAGHQLSLARAAFAQAVLPDASARDRQLQGCRARQRQAILAL